MSTSGLGNGSTSYVIGNIIHDIHHNPAKDYNPNTGWSEAGIMLVGVPNRYVVNNTIYDADAGINSPADGTMYMFNNVISDITEPEGNHIFIESATATSVLDNNLFYQDGQPVRIRWGSGAAQDLPLFEASHADNTANCINADPRFLDPANRDLHVQATSPAVNHGTLSAPDVYAVFQDLYGLDIRVDYDGAPRPRGGEYDIGAFEQ